jgi:glyoxylase-like metal-dependent hydrolase (beta-lactamase superfamily II)
MVLISGHAPRSIALLDRMSRRLFVGDTVSDAQIYMFGDGRDLRAFIESLLKLETMAVLIDVVHSAHSSPVLSGEMVRKNSCRRRTAAERRIEG